MHFDGAASIEAYLFSFNFASDFRRRLPAVSHVCCLLPSEFVNGHLSTTRLVAIVLNCRFVKKYGY